MKQVLQDLRKGTTFVEEVPVPLPAERQILVRTSRSLLSPGTERMLLEFGKANILQKARQQPERVRKVIDKIRTDGLLTTLDAVRAKLNEPLPLGYCNVGTVERCGGDATARTFPPGTRVATNGWHAEFVAVPRTLAARIPDNVTDDEAVFTVLGAIALQAVRLASPTLGETVLVMGTGLVGLLTVQLLRANGCRVLASDFKDARLRLAEQFGATPIDLSQGQDPVEAARAATQGRGADAVIIAAATSSNDPIRQAARACRQRGRIILAGVTGLELDRTEFFRKEITFQVSCSYGPGRYDREYEEMGHDYPPGFVRWTAQRNFEAVLHLMAERKLDVQPLITHRFPIAQAEEAYELLSQPESALGVLLEYPTDAPSAQTSLRIDRAQRRLRKTNEQIAVIGTGNFARRVILPVLQAEGAGCHTVCSARGVTAATAARRFGFANASTNAAAVCESLEISAVIIATRHNTHADLACRALHAGKHVFVEKPLAIDLEQLSRVALALEHSAELTNPPILFAGFNRRFSPMIRELAKAFAPHRQSLCMSYHVNAGEVPADSWIHDPQVGGGRLIGEVCHFLDTMRFLAGSPWESIVADSASSASDGIPENRMTVTVRFKGGALGTVHYWANGPAFLPKESLFLVAGGMAAELENFRRLTFHGFKGRPDQRHLKQRKGHREEIRAFLEAIRGKEEPECPPGEWIETTLASFAALEALRTGVRQNRSTWYAKLSSGVSRLREGRATPG